MSSCDTHRIDVAIGGQHRGKVKNVSPTWRKFVDELSEPMADKAVTFAQFEKLDLSKKSDRKAMAGYIMPGHFRDGIRKISHQKFRSMIAIDIDHATSEQVALIREGRVPLAQFVYFMHTTRSHCPERPRARVWLPIKRNVDAEEAFALTRLVSLLLADDPGEAIEIPDLVSFRFNQIMYKPSISKDQEFWAVEHTENADILDVDSFLSEHPEWRDVSTLPRQERDDDLRRTDPSAKMEDPREKQGIIGAFCRTYDVRQAIEEFLSDRYAPADSSTDERYSYLGGETRNGAIVYDDGLFLHSHHGSDPAAGLHNAWDLIRIHKFGDLDKDAKDDTSPGNLPSFKAMREWASDLHGVRVELGAQFEDAFDDVEDEDEDEDEDLIGTRPPDEDLIGTRSAAGSKKTDKEWLAGLRRKANGDLENVLHNAALICQNDPRIAPCIAYNEFTLDPVALKPIRSKTLSLPSSPVDSRTGYRTWEPDDDTAIRLIFSAPNSMKGYEFDPAKQSVEEAVLAAGKKHKFHPVKDKIREFHAAWVAARRRAGLIDTLPQRYLGCPDDAFHRESSLTLMLGIIARVFEPGCKFDSVTIIRGDQGGGKSRFWRALGLDIYFGELPKDFDRTDRMIEAMRGKLILEMGEMAGLRRETAESAKEFITRSEDRHRLAYASRVGTYPRQSVLVGTSNRDEILHDPTGNRRFRIWEDIHSEARDFFIDVEALEQEVPMLYGEAYQAYLDLRAEQPHGDLYLDLRTPEARRIRDQISERHRHRTAPEIIAEVIQEWLDEPVSADEAEAPGADMFDSDGPTPMYLRNMVTAKEAFIALKHRPELENYRNADVATYGKAMQYIPGWVSLERVRRHGEKNQTTWYCRGGNDGPRFVPVPRVVEVDIDDMI